jgi:hypothetical protein
VLIAILIAVELAGILGALLAIPVAGILQIIARDIWDTRRGRLKTQPTVGEDETPVDNGNPSADALPEADAAPDTDRINGVHSGARTAQVPRTTR